MGDRSCHGLHIRPSHLGELSQAISLWVGKINIGDVYNHRYERNGKFCIAELALLPGLLAY